MDKIQSPLDRDSAAAILLLLLGEEEAATILKNLCPDEVRSLGTAMFAIHNVDEKDVNAALDLFVDQSHKMPALCDQPEPRVRAIMTHALGGARAESILSSISPDMDRPELGFMRWLDAKDVLAIMTQEPPQVGALILAVADPNVAAQALGGLPDGLQADLVCRAAQLSSVTTAAVAELEAIASRYSAERKTSKKIKLSNRKDVAKIIAKLPKSGERKMLASLRRMDKALAQEVEDEMFVFDNLAALDEKELGTVLRSVDTSILSVALRGTSADLAETFFGCMSTRAAQSIRDEMVESKPVKKTDVEAAQRVIINIARSLADSGSVTIGANGDDYV